MKRTKLLRHLRNHGCTILREGARHTIAFNPAGGLQTPIPRHPEIKGTLTRAICKQLDVPAPR